MHQGHAALKTATLFGLNLCAGGGDRVCGL